MNLSTKRLFLWDGIGGLITACFLYFILGGFNHLFGMPKPILNILSLIAVGCAVYSLSCYFLLRSNRQYFLLVIAVINIVYCVASIILVICYFPALTTLCILYFTVEIIVIGSLAYLELKQVAGHL